MRLWVYGDAMSNNYKNFLFGILFIASITIAYLYKDNIFLPYWNCVQPRAKKEEEQGYTGDVILYPLQLSLVF